MSGKKNKRVKGKTVDLGDFLSDGPQKDGWTVVQATNWDEDSSGPSLGVIELPKGPMSSRGGNVDEASVPREPPFVAFLGNLPFEIVEEEVANFFGDLKLKSVRLAKDSSERPRGFGHADFEDRQALIQALGLDGEKLRNRAIRVCLPDNENDNRGGFGRDRGMRSGGFGSRGERPIERDLPNDWRAAAREEQSTRGFDNYNRSDRSDRYGREGGFGDRDRGGNDNRDWRNDSRGFSGRYEPPRDRSDAPAAPAERPRLNLAPRTKPKEEIKVVEEAEPVKKIEKPKIEKPKAADIFGAAKPVDTAAKLREIEARLEAKRKEEAEKAKIQEKNEQQEQQQQQQQKGPSKETSPRHEQTDEEPTKKWRDEIRDEKEKKERKQRSERRAPAQVLEEPQFNPTSKNKYADLEVSENQDESDGDEEIQAEN